MKNCDIGLSELRCLIVMHGCENSCIKTKNGVGRLSLEGANAGGEVDVYTREVTMVTMAAG